MALSIEMGATVTPSPSLQYARRAKARRATVRRVVWHAAMCPPCIVLLASCGASGFQAHTSKLKTVISFSDPKHLDEVSDRIRPTSQRKPQLPTPTDTNINTIIVMLII